MPQMLVLAGFIICGVCVVIAFVYERIRNYLDASEHPGNHQRGPMEGPSLGRRIFDAIGWLYSPAFLIGGFMILVGVFIGK